MPETEKQREASAETGKSWVVTAGAGSGKTMVLVNRYINLITAATVSDPKVSLESTVAITFTEKAATEMRARVEKELRRTLSSEDTQRRLLERLPMARISTIDSFCLNIVRQNPLMAGVVPEFGIISQSDARALMQRKVRACLETMMVRLKTEDVEMLQEAVSGGSNKLRGFLADMSELTLIAASRGAFELASGDEAPVGVNKILTDLMMSSNEEYKKELATARVLDFSGIEAAALKLLRTKAGNVIRQGISSVLVDEYQDTNEVQDEIVRLLVAEPGTSKADILDTPKLFIVGDKNQSIYAFRGANPGLLGEWIDVARSKQRHINLDTNFRSHQMLIRSFNMIFPSVLKGSYEKTISVYEEADYDEEPKIWAIIADYNDYLSCVSKIVETIKEITSSKGSGETVGAYQYKDIALLVRSSAHMAPYKEAFRKHGVPYVLAKADNLFSSDAALFLADLLRLITDREDEHAAFAVLASPAVGVTDAGLAWLKLKYDNLHRILGDRYHLLIGNRDSGLLDMELSNIKGIMAVVENARMKRACMNLGDLLEMLSVEHGLEEMMLRGYGRQGLADFRKIVEMVQDAVLNVGSMQELKEYIEDNCEVRTDISEPDLLDEDDNAIRILTIHASKGLEFKVVILAKADMKTSKNNKGSLELDSKGWKVLLKSSEQYTANQERFDAMEMEERARLIYVALTRAKDLIILADSQKTKEFKIEDAAKYFLTEIRRISELKESSGIKIIECNVKSQGCTELDAEMDSRRAEYRHLELTGESFDDGMMRKKEVALDRFSASSLRLFQECPRDFLKRHWLRLGVGKGRTPSDANGTEGEKFLSVDLGILVHKIVSITDDVDKLDEAVEQAVRELLSSSYPDKGMVKKARDVAGEYLKTVRLTNSRNIGREVPFFMLLGDFILEGSLDRLDVDESGAYVITDLKTYRSGVYDTKQLTDKYMLQMEIYSLAVRKEYGTNKVKGRFFFIPTADGIDKSTVIEEVELDSETNIQQKLMKLMKKSSGLPFEIGELSQACGLCEKKDACAKRTGFPIDDYKEQLEELLKHKEDEFLDNQEA